MQTTWQSWVLASMLFWGAGLAPVLADTAHFTVTFDADTRDLHLTAGSGNAFKNVKITGPDGKEAPPNSSNGTDLPSGAYNARWSSAPGAGTYTVDLNGHMGSDTGWGGKIALTTDGSLKRPDNNQYTGTFASISPVFDPDSGFASVYASNGLTDTPLDISGIQVSVISDASSIDSPDWMDATGPTYTFDNIALSANAAQTLLGSVPFDASGWLKITDTANGSQEILGYSAAAVPEPYTAPSIGASLVLLGVLRRKKCSSR